LSVHTTLDRIKPKNPLGFFLFFVYVALGGGGLKKA